MTFTNQTRIGIKKQRGFWLRYFLESSDHLLGRFLVVFIIAVLLSQISQSQAFCVGKNGKPCTEAEFNQLFCKPEKAPANLFISQPVRLTGQVFDSSGFPIDFDGTRPGYQTIVQIRNAMSGEVLFAVPLRANAEFEFESVPIGTYRLTFVWMKDGNFRRLPLADQPKEVHCTAPKECRISPVITIHGTDNLIDFCPPK